MIYLVKAVCYDGGGAFSLGPGRAEAPAAGEVRLNVAYCGICGTDLHIAHGAMDHRVRAPQVIGHEMSGTVAEVGRWSRRVQSGRPRRRAAARRERRGTFADKGYSHVSRGLKFLGIDTPGAFQSLVDRPGFTVPRSPAAVDLRLAALVEPLAVACHDVRRAELAAGENALVIGAGPIGLLVALTARAQGARIVVSEVNPARAAFAAELGLETVEPPTWPRTSKR